MPSRSTNRFKQKPALNFGDLMLPILGVVFLSILIIGIKVLFFPSTPAKGPIVVNQPPSRTTMAPAETASPVEVTARPVVATPVAPAQAPVATPAPNKVVTAEPVKSTRAVSVTPSKPAPTRTDETRVAAAAPKEAPAAVRTIEKSAYLVQSGSFTDDRAAGSVAKELRARGYSVAVRQAEVKGRSFFRVFAAGGMSSEEAATVAAKLKALGYPTLVVKNP